VNSGYFLGSLSSSALSTHTALLPMFAGTSVIPFEWQIDVTLRS